MLFRSDPGAAVRSAAAMRCRREKYTLRLVSACGAPTEPAAGCAGAALETRTTFCRVCHASCPIEVDIGANRVLAVRGVKDDPLFEGYTCHRPTDDELIDLACAGSRLPMTEVRADRVSSAPIGPWSCSRPRRGPPPASRCRRPI